MGEKIVTSLGKYYYLTKGGVEKVTKDIAEMFMISDSNQLVHFQKVWKEKCSINEGLNNLVSFEGRTQKQDKILAIKKS